MKTTLAAAFAATLLLATLFLATGAAQQPAANDNAHMKAKIALDEEIRCLNQWVNDAEATHQRVHELWTKGARGGSAEEEAMSRYYMCLSKARRAQARQDLDATREWYGRAVTAADDTVEALQQAYDVGLVTLDVLLAMQQNRAEVKIELARL